MKSQSSQVVSMAQRLLVMNFLSLLVVWLVQKQLFVKKIQSSQVVSMEQKQLVMNFLNLLVE